MPRTAPPRPGAAVALALVLACVPKDPYDPGPATVAPDDSTGADATTDLPDDPTAATTGNPDTPTTTGADPGTTGEPGTSDSGDSTGPGLVECAVTPPGVQLALTRILQGDPEDMSIQTCGHTAPAAAYTVVATAPEQLELAACAELECGACDDADRLVLTLSLPDPLPGLPPDPAPGDCVRLSAAWERPLDGDQCTISALALLRTDGGVPEPVPRYMYRHSETLPASDTYGMFALTGALSGPGDLTCPCDADCCDDPPGTRRLRFTAQLGKAEIEVPPMLPGDVFPAFAYGTPEGDDLFGEVALARAFVPAACDAPAQYEWLLRVTP